MSILGKSHSHRSFLARCLVVGVVVLTLALSVTAQEFQEYEENEVTASSAFTRSHQLGARLGGWSNRGAGNPGRIDIPSGEYYQTDFSSANVYLEGYVGFRLKSFAMLELSMGISSRGDVVLVEYPDTLSTSIGSLLIYPILAKLKLYPLGAKESKFHPYLFGGGGLYYGRHDIQIASGYDAYFRQVYGGDSESKFDYTIGAGFDWPVATMVGLEFQVQYMAAKFSGALVGVRDYSSVTITVGVKHIFRSTKNEKKNPYYSRSGR